MLAMRNFGEENKTSVDKPFRKFVITKESSEGKDKTSTDHVPIDLGELSGSIEKTTSLIISFSGRTEELKSSLMMGAIMSNSE